MLLGSFGSKLTQIYHPRLDKKGLDLPKTTIQGGSKCTQNYHPQT